VAFDFGGDRKHTFQAVHTSALRLAVHVAVALGLGMLGYSYFEKLAWRDALLNSAMTGAAARSTSECSGQ
jgi:hypothetical protein